MFFSFLKCIKFTHYGHVRKCEALTFLLDNIYIRFGTKLCRQIVGFPMGTNCATLVTDLFLFCYERDFMMSLSVENQSEINEAFRSTSRYLDDLLNIDNTYDGLISQIYHPHPPPPPTQNQLNKGLRLRYHDRNYLK